METNQKQSMNQNLKKLTETAGFSDITQKITADILELLKTTYV